MLGLLPHLARRYFELAKEVLDIVLGFFLLILSLPILAGCAILIKLTSRGAIFFTQTRVGQGGKHFRMYKLRTMYSDAENRSGAVWCGDKDPRIVPACRWMRRSHVDELPQLLNVIKGEMGVVGPRPIVADELARYGDWAENLLDVRPGVRLLQGPARRA